MSERAKYLASAYAKATAVLRHHHDEEFHEILEDIYKEDGVVVKKRITGSRKKRADLDKALAALGNTPPV